MGQVTVTVVPGSDTAVPRALQEFYFYREQAPAQKLTYSEDSVVIMFRPEFFGPDRLPGSIRVSVEWAGPPPLPSGFADTPLRSEP